MTERFQFRISPKNVMIYATQSGQKPKTGVQYMYVAKSGQKLKTGVQYMYVAKSGVLSVQFIISLNVYPMIDFSINEKYQLYK